MHNKKIRANDSLYTSRQSYAISPLYKSNNKSGQFLNPSKTKYVVYMHINPSVNHSVHLSDRGKI